MCFPEHTKAREYSSFLFLGMLLYQIFLSAKWRVLPVLPGTGLVLLLIAGCIPDLLSWGQDLPPKLQLTMECKTLISAFLSCSLISLTDLFVSHPELTQTATEHSYMRLLPKKKKKKERHNVSISVHLVFWSGCIGWMTVSGSHALQHFPPEFYPYKAFILLLECFSGHLLTYGKHQEEIYA